MHDHAWFTAYAPYDNPKLVVTVILENAGGGSSNAAPLARKVMDYYLNQRLPQVEKYNVPIQQKDLSQESEQINGR